MSDGVRIWASDGTTILFDSLTAVGGVVADYRYYPAGSAGGTISYPQWAGFSCYLMDAGGSGNNVSLSTSAGYPVITVVAPSSAMAFTLVVY